jgi:hypothetical protein
MLRIVYVCVCVCAHPVACAGEWGFNDGKEYHARFHQYTCSDPYVCAVLRVRHSAEERVDCSG